MGKAEIAEELLALVTTPERAGSIVGDLVEDNTEPFWEGVVSTAFSLLWRDMQVRPGRTFALAVLLWAPYSLMSVLFTRLGNLIYGSLTEHTGLELVAGSIPPAEDWMGPLIWYVVMPFVMGRCIGIACKERELAAAAVAAIVWPLLAVTSKVPAPDYPAVQLFLLAGAAHVRATRESLWKREPLRSGAV